LTERQKGREDEEENVGTRMSLKKRDVGEI
jgi:hypothetical protein